MTSRSSSRAFGVNEGVIVKDVLVGKPAAQAGVHAGDVITYIDGQKITSGPMLLDIIASSAVDRSVQVKILRSGKEQTIPVMIGDREKVIYDLDSASSTAPLDAAVPANPPDRVLGIAVQVAPQKVVKQFGLSGVAISSVQKGSVGAEIFDTAPVDSPYVIDSVVVDGRVTEVRAPADFDRAVAGLKRGAKFAFGVHVPERDPRGRFLNKYDHTFVATDDAVDRRFDHQPLSSICDERGFLHMSSTYRNFIGGRWVAPSSGKTIDNRNPAKNSERIGAFPHSTKKDVDAAVAAAAAAWKSWRLVPAPKRAEILFRAAELIAARKEEFARDMTREMGKVLKEARGDVQEAIDMTYYMAGEGRRLFGQTTPAELPDKFAMSTRNPLGVCGLITPWNFPMAIPSWKVMPALVCGNTVVLKPAEDTPLSAVHFVKTLEAAGVPPGVVNLVMGSGTEAGAPLSQHSGVSVVSFTGSCEVGNLVASACASILPARASGNGRQERPHGHGRWGYRSCRGWRAVGRFRHQWSAMHGGKPGCGP